jgi:6-phosphogluconolactonase
VAADCFEGGSIVIACRAANANAAQREFVVMRGPKTLARYVASWLLNRILVVSGVPAVCLAGGETPVILYRMLAEAPWRDRIPWQRVHWFWSDERFVRSDDPRSNYHMARAALFDHVPVPIDNIHPIVTDRDLQESAAAYEQVLKQFHGASRLSVDQPLFSATLLGIGADGHTASLFPGSAALDERTRWVAAVPEAQPEPRITLTIPALERSSEIAFLVTGARKRDILGRVRRDCDLPASRIATAGRLHWFVDRAAAGTSVA